MFFHFVINIILLEWLFDFFRCRRKKTGKNGEFFQVHKGVKEQHSK